MNNQNTWSHYWLDYKFRTRNKGTAISEIDTVHEQNKLFSRSGKYVRVKGIRTVIEKILRGDREAFDNLVLSKLPYAIYKAKRFQKQYPESDFSDMVSSAIYGTVKAIANIGNILNPSSYAIYVKNYIELAILDYIASTYYLYSIPKSIIRKIKMLERLIELCYKTDNRMPSINEFCYIINIDKDKCISLLSAIGYIKSPAKETNNQESRINERWNKVVSAMTKLKKREQYIISSHYGLSRLKRKTLNQIAEEFNLSTERIRQIETRAIKRIRESLNL